jgi:hypothetical protein
MDRNTIMSLIALAGKKCQKHMESMIKDLDVADVQMDEIWSYVRKKERRRVGDEKDANEIGDAWGFLAIERGTKLILAFHLGKRDAASTDMFVYKLSVATSQKRFQLTSDGFYAYPPAVQMFLNRRVHYAALSTQESDSICPNLIDPNVAIERSRGPYLFENGVVRCSQPCLRISQHVHPNCPNSRNPRLERTISQCLRQTRAYGGNG